MSAETTAVNPCPSCGAWTDARLCGTCTRRLEESRRRRGGQEIAGQQRDWGSRSSIPVLVPFECDLVLTYGNGLTVHEEWTAADTVARGGARLFTALPTLRVGDVVKVSEVAGDFETRAVVRKTYDDPGPLRRVSVDFLDRAAPARLVGARRRGSGPPSAAMASIDVRGAPSQRNAPVPQRRVRAEPRFGIPVELVLRRQVCGGVAEERTVAEDISRGGARVKTSMTLLVGEVLELEEVGGDFRTRAEVRGTNVLPDRVRRASLCFLEDRAPGRLVGSGDEPQGQETPEQRRRRIRAAFEGLEDRSHFEVLGVSPSATLEEIQAAFDRLTKDFDPGEARRNPEIADLSAELLAVFIRLGAAYEILRDEGRRAAYERTLEIL